ncbi:MAG: hypothetical protein QOJ84_1127 [Bradyrhizobium sp.]|nr:hypothetical protein [Bradyrhizobium sp.]
MLLGWTQNIRSIHAHMPSGRGLVRMRHPSAAHFRTDFVGGEIGPIVVEYRSEILGERFIVKQQARVSIKRYAEL